MDEVICKSDMCFEKAYTTMYEFELNLMLFNDTWSH